MINFLALYYLFTTYLKKNYLFWTLGKALILREPEVRAVLSLEKAKGTLHKKLRGLMARKGDWPRIRLELQVPVLVWTAVIGPFHTVISKEKEVYYPWLRSFFILYIWSLTSNTQR